MDQQSIKKFQKTVWDFYKKNKRSFPWRETQDPYRILVSEIMLQQTQAGRVVSYYNNWLQKFPTPQSLAKAPFSKIYPLWQGLGYNRRALALQKLAKEVVEKYDGQLPASHLDLEELPGIGPYTARAVSIFAYNRPLTCIETNIRRVFIHHFFPEAETVSDAEIMPLLEAALPVKRSREWHWALMDYGAYLKTAFPNANRRHKDYTIQSKFEGSLRQIRGRVLKSLANGPQTIQQLDAPKAVLATLEKEGFIEYKKSKYSLK